MISEQLEQLPTTPGVYLFKDSSKKVLYVGKAINLKNRVRSYFQDIDGLPPKTRALVEKIVDIETIHVETELEALLLEADLIKRYRPKYNINLKDDKFYKYIVIEHKQIELQEKNSDEKDKKVIVEKITTARNQNQKQADYFGPFPETQSIEIILKTMRRIFPYRDCSTAKFHRYEKAHRPCLYGHIGLCPAPCQNEEGRLQNKENIQNIKKYLLGDRKKVIQAIRREMTRASKAQEYEKAAILRDQVRSYDYLTQEKRESKEYVMAPTLKRDKAHEALASLREILRKHLPIDMQMIEEQFRIEMYDISNFQGANSVGAMTVLTGGETDKGEYRRFRIRSKETPDDFAMMQEMLKRRFSPANRERWRDPQLIVIDGGKGQLSSALEILHEDGINIPAIGLAKRFEEIIFPKDKTYNVLQLPKDSPALHLLIKIRDEAHRFGITYYRSLHRKQLRNN